MTAPATKAKAAPHASSGLLRWQGVLGRMRDRPVAAAAIGLVSLAVVLAIAWLLVIPQIRAYRDLSAARAAIQEKDLLEARARLERCLEVWPDSGEIHFELSRVCRRLGDFETARRELNAAERRNWLSEQLDLEFILQEVQQEGPSEQNETILMQYLVFPKKHPDEALILEALVRGYLQTYRMAEAEQWLSTWIERYPDDWAPRFIRGQALQRNLNKSSSELARTDYLKVLELKPDHHEARRRLAEVIVKSGRDYQEALGHFEQYLQTFPQDVDALLGLARCQRMNGDLEGARGTLERLFRIQREHAGAFFVMGLIASDLQKDAEALEWLQRSERLQPGEVNTMHQTAIVLRRLKRTAEAERVEKTLEATKAKLQEMDDVTRQIIRQPKNADLRHRAGVILLGVSGQEKEGVRWLHSALRCDPGHRPSHESLAAYYEKQGDAESQRRAEFHRRLAAGPTSQPGT